MTTPAKPPPTCKECGVVIPYRGGPRPRLCVTHRPSRNKARDIRRIENAASAARAEAAALSAHVAEGSPDESAVDAATEASAVQALAIGLGMDKDPRRAAALVGLHRLPGKQIAELMNKAKAEHQDLIDGQPSAQGALIRHAISLVALNIIRKNAKLNVAACGSTLKALVQAQDLLIGGTTPVFSNVTVVFDGPETP